MEIQDYIKQQEELYNLLLIFIENDQENEKEIEESVDFHNFINYIVNQEILLNKERFRSILISYISSNHYRYPALIAKIEKILLRFETTIKQDFLNTEIFNIFRYNKLIILFLFEKKIIIPDKFILQIIKEKIRDEYQHHFIQFFYPELKLFIKENELQNIQIQDMKMFIEKRKIGENDSYVCELIRNDSYEKFGEYLFQTNLSVSSKIEQSIYETNSFLIKEKDTTLIEYASFFGSIQIFKYLLLKDAELRPKLWLYAIHGNNAEIIHLIEEKHIQPNDESYEECLKESIKCHNNAIKNYIQINYLNTDVDKSNIQNNYKKNSNSYYYHYHNFSNFPRDFDCKFSFFYACDYGYTQIVNFLLKNKSLNVNDFVI